MKDDKTLNWFTALGVLSVFRGSYMLSLFQEVRKVCGCKPLTSVQKKNLLNAVAQGAKLTKADAG